MSTKQYIRKLLNFFHLDITQNLTYDRLTKLIIKKAVKENSNCIDIGCHKGEILDLILQNAPKGTHFAFEPIPHFYDLLVQKFGDKATVFPHALANTEGTTSFNYVKNAPAYSGIKKRSYSIKNPIIEKITVNVKPLDAVIPKNTKIDFIKIDVEGGEFDVLKGASRILQENSPLIIFENGLGASEFYDTNPKELFDFFKKKNYKLYLLKSYVKKLPPLSIKEFENVYHNNEEYYFVASKENFNG